MQQKIFILTWSALFLFNCNTMKITGENIAAKAKTLDMGDQKSSTLIARAWEALDRKAWLEVFAYTEKCLDMYGATAVKMNAELDDFAPKEKAHAYWALNDCGTALFIMANAYEKLEMLPEAVAAYKRLAQDFTYCQCWDPKGWFWHPAENAAAKADELEFLLEK
ncbi:MAG TPA: beta-glucanase precursor [Spirochaetota bacterium]|nr:beta-glucanase precursor [Spirochaetota bacterium]